VGASIEESFEGAGCTGALLVRRLSDDAEVGVRSDDVWLAASVIKVPIALEFFVQAEQGQLDPTLRVTLQPGMSTPGPSGISLAQDAVTISLRDLVLLMLSISDNAATDAVLAAVSAEAVNRRLRDLGCQSTVLVDSIQASVDTLAVDLGFPDYATLLRAQAGELGADARAASVDQGRISSSRVLDARRASRTTARDMVQLLRAVWRDEVGAPAACAELRRVMATQVSRRLAVAVPDGGSLAAKTGALFGRVRNEVAVIGMPDGEHYAVAVLTRPHQPFVRVSEIDLAMGQAVKAAINELATGSRAGTS